MSRKYYSMEIPVKEDCDDETTGTEKIDWPYNKERALQSSVKEKGRKFVRYSEGAELYSMCKHTFMKLAADAHAVYKINRLSLVNTKVFEEYLETFRI